MTVTLPSANYVIGIAANQEMVPAFEDFIGRESPKQSGAQNKTAVSESLRLWKPTPLQLS